MVAVAQNEQQYPQQPDMANTYTSPQVMNPNEKEASDRQQQKHSTVDGGKKWAFGLFDCFAPLDTCCISFWCPCYLFGKTYQRNKTGEKEPSGFNGMCMQRQNTREKHDINGGCFSDFGTSCCCACCALIQEEKESVVRVTGLDPKTGAVYQPVSQMSYS